MQILLMGAARQPLASVPPHIHQISDYSETKRADNSRETGLQALVVTLMRCLHDPANFQQMYIQNTCAYAGRLLDHVNTL